MHLPIYSREASNSFRIWDKDVSFLYPASYAVHNLRDTGKKHNFFIFRLNSKIKSC